MTSIEREVVRLSHTLLLRGGLMLALGAIAVVRPEELLIPALLSVGALTALTGLYELSIALSIRQTAAWRLVLAHGLAAVAFGLLTSGVAAPPFEWTRVAIAIWFAGNGAIAWFAARLLHSRLRAALCVWAVVNALLAALAVSLPRAAIFAVLFLGAVYAAIEGAVQSSAGVVLRSLVNEHRRRRAPPAMPSALG